MKDPGELYEVNEEALASLDGARLPMLVLLSGFVDAGQLTRMLEDHLRELGPQQTLVEFDHDQLHDYRARRPPMIFDTNQWVSMEAFKLSIDVVEGPGQRFLLFTGPEPDSQWERATRAVLQASRQVGASELISAGGIPMGVPHTRPVLVTEHATDPESVSGNPVWLDRVTVPGSFAGMLEYVAGQQGVPARGFVAHVPHYLAQGTYAPGQAALLLRIQESTGLDLRVGPAEEEADKAIAALETEVAADGELQRLVASLEEQYDHLSERGHTEVPSLDEIGFAVERFLAEQVEGEDD